MFTGIVQGQGRIAAVTPTAAGCRLVIEAPSDWARPVAGGDSIAVDGCCLTVVGPHGDAVTSPFTFDVIPQTLAVTTLGALRGGDLVNLEAAALPTTALGGHLVQGHVDALAEVVEVLEAGDDYRLRLRPPAETGLAIVERGSVTVAGVSLTVAARAPETFDVALIPTTREVTTLGALAAGARVNLETDYIAKIVVNYLAQSGLADALRPS